MSLLFISTQVRSRRRSKRINEVEAKPGEVADVAGGEMGVEAGGGGGDLGIAPLQWASLTFGDGDDIAQTRVAAASKGRMRSLKSRVCRPSHQSRSLPRRMGSGW